MSLGSRVRRNFTRRLLCLFWVNIRTANQFADEPPPSWRVIPMVALFEPEGDHGQHGAK
jgi:hypothetical protein